VQPSSSLSGGYFAQGELISLGFGAVGPGTRVSRRVEIPDPSRIFLGSYVRIDAFVTITIGSAGFLVIGSYTHIADRVRLSAAAGIRIGAYSGLATNSCLLSTSDDYSGSSLVGPQVPSHLTAGRAGEIEMGRLTVLGTNSVVMPGCHLGEGVSVGACSMVNRSLPPWGVYFGTPVKFIGRRDKAALNHYNELEGLNGSDT
jgi:acetyltransferase-like isoleucine patch superfamily enzyme